MMDALRKMIIQDYRHFLLLSRTKQELLVDKMVQRMVSRATLCCHTDPLYFKKLKGEETRWRWKDFEFENSCYVIFAVWSVFCRLFLCRACTQGCSPRKSFVHWALWRRSWWMRFSFSWTAASSLAIWISSGASATAAARWTSWLVSCKNLLSSGNVIYSTLLYIFNCWGQENLFFKCFIE